MGNGMNKILPGLYIGNFRDAKDVEQLKNNNITHIVSVHDNAKKILDNKEYLCIQASDTPDQDLSIFFPQVINFIHRARLDGGGVLVHCLAGVSRSVTITAAYIMTVTNMDWKDTLNSIRGARTVANPNFGFQKQLQNYYSEHIEEERKKFKATFPNPSPFNDEEVCRQNLHSYQHFILTGKDRSKSDDLYPLPHRAYQRSTDQEEKDSSSTGGSKDDVKDVTRGKSAREITVTASLTSTADSDGLEEEVDKLFVSSRSPASDSKVKRQL